MTTKRAERKFSKYRKIKKISVSSNFVSRGTPKIINLFFGKYRPIYAAFSELNYSDMLHFPNSYIKYFQLYTAWLLANLAVHISHTYSSAQDHNAGTNKICQLNHYALVTRITVPLKIVKSPKKIAISFSAKSL